MKGAAYWVVSLSGVISLSSALVGCGEDGQTLPGACRRVALYRADPNTPRAGLSASQKQAYNDNFSRECMTAEGQTLTSRTASGLSVVESGDAGVENGADGG